MTVSEPAQWIDRDRAKEVVSEFLGRDYANWTWDDMVGRAGQESRTCLLQHVRTELPESRWLEAGFYAGRNLRSRYRNDRRSWNARNWAAEYDIILDAILEVVRECECMNAPSLAEVEPPWLPGAEVQANGFVPWRLFRRRDLVPQHRGIYVFACFEGLPEPEANPLSKHVIYIGYSGHLRNRRTIAQRLDEFERTALGQFGHSAGWTYRTEFVRDWDSLMHFRNTYVTWNPYGQDSVEHPRDAEKSLIAQFRATWSERPFLNRKD